MIPGEAVIRPLDLARNSVVSLSRVEGPEIGAEDHHGEVDCVISADNNMSGNLLTIA